ncbi:MAG: aminomethyl-transferring glycine dehydrogenase subunit GcvPA [Spirochaetes bacterium]|nr:aminomethyl-transferring glycine dehydrogenase subunit GcvPA [Spirochaetota bacterium]
MRYIPNTAGDIESMLSIIGVRDPDDLFRSVPEEFVLKEDLVLPPALSEPDLLSHMREMGAENAHAGSYKCFLGGGAYNHFIPSAVARIVSRSEFYTAYTPYQPEVSQGTLQAMFEYQTLMCELLGMDVSNASLYCGASSSAEAVLMALRVKKGGTVVLSEAVSPEYRRVIRTYCRHGAASIVEAPFDESGATDVGRLEELVNGTTAAVLVQSPNFFGVVEDIERLSALVHEKKSLFVCSFTEPLAFGILRPPGDFDADICCGEGQSFGIPPGFGGPHLGILTAKENLVRNMPGRIVGRTKDEGGKDAYVLTLSAREQHIRREKAKSNVCTNQGLCALTATVYLEGLGKSGIRTLALANHEGAEYAKKKLLEADWVKLGFSGPTFNEFVLRLGHDPTEVVTRLLDKRMIAGIPLGKFYPGLGDCLLVTVTELVSKNDIDALADAFKELY